MDANTDSPQEQLPKLPSYHLRTFLSSLKRAEFIHAWNAETRTFFVQHASRRKPRLARYEFLRYLNARWRDSFEGETPTLASAFYSGLLKGAAALVRLAEKQAAAGHSEGVEGLAAISTIHFIAVWNVLDQEPDFNLIRWLAQYPFFQAPYVAAARYVGLDLSTNDGPNEISHHDALGVFAIIACLLAISENPGMPLPNYEDGEEVA